MAAECGIMAAGSVIYADGTNGSDGGLLLVQFITVSGSVTDLCNNRCNGTSLVNVSSNLTIKE